MSGEQREEIFELLRKAEASELGNAELARLNTLLEQSDEACRAVLELAMLDAELAFRTRMNAADGTAAAAVTATLTPHSLRGSWRSLLPGGRKMHLLSLAALFFLVVASIAWVQFLQPQVRQLGAHAMHRGLTAVRAPQPAATLVAFEHAVFMGREYAANESLLEGTVLSLVEGEAQIGMACGADVFLTAPCSLRFVSANHVELLSGVIAANVASWGSGFTVDTDALRVIDLGTKFAVAASAEDVETHVLQGKVRVQRRQASIDGRRSVLLDEGEAIRVDRRDDRAVRIDAEEGRFRSVESEIGPFKPILLKNTGIGLAIGDEDPNWRITAGAVGAGYHGPQYAVVCTPTRGYADNEPDRSQWISATQDLEEGVLRNSTFTFETEFELSGFDVSSVQVALQILADNGVKAVRINGNAVPMTAWTDNEPMQLFARERFRLVEIQSGFEPGVNTIEIDVWNGTFTGKQWIEHPNPMAVRVEFQGYGRPLATRPQSSPPEQPKAGTRQPKNGLAENSVFMASRIADISGWRHFTGSKQMSKSFAESTLLVCNE